MIITTSAVENNDAPLKARFGRFEVDEAEARLLDDGAPLRLAPKPFAVLCALMRTPQALVSKSALLDRVWGHQYVSDSVLKTTIRDVRAVLGDDPRQPRYIETVSCRGYRFIGAITPATELPPTPQLQPTEAPAAVVIAGDAPIGRARELDRLREAWRAAGAGKHQVVWIAGEAGVGKTTLIESFMHEVGAASCLRGYCVHDGAEQEPGLPILETLPGLCRRDPEVLDLLRQIAPTWLSRLPWLCTPQEREALQREVADAGPGRMLREMSELLDRCSARRPLLLVTEDLQWADELTVQLMGYVARRRSGARLMWLASFRLTEVVAAERPLAAIRQELRLHGLGREIVLDAFSEAEVAQYVAAHAPTRAAEPGLVHALFERTDGLPLFVAELMDRLLVAKEGDAAQAPIRQQLATTAVPEMLTAIVERYLDELTPKQRALLEAASACGMQFRLSTLANVLQGELALVATTCAELARRQRWLRDVPAPESGAAPADGAYVFRHALHREVLHKRLDPLARVELQRRVRASHERERLECRSAASIVGIRSSVRGDHPVALPV